MEFGFKKIILGRGLKWYELTMVGLWQLHWSWENIWRIIQQTRCTNTAQTPPESL